MYFSHNNKNGLQAATALYLFMKIVDDILESVVLDILKYCLFQRNVFLTAYDIWHTTKFNFYLKTKHTEGIYLQCQQLEIWCNQPIFDCNFRCSLVALVQTEYLYQKNTFLENIWTTLHTNQICHICHINIFYCCFSMTSLWEKVLLPVVLIS